MDVLLPANLLAWAIQAGVIVLVAAPLPRLLGLWLPRVRMVFWRAVLVACLLLPVLQPWAIAPVVPASPPAPAITVDVAGVPPGAAAVPAAPSAPTAGPTATWSLEAVARLVIVAGVLLRLAWLGLGLVTVGRLRRAASRLWPRPPSVDLAATLAGTDAEFLVSATTSRPVTCGVLWPVVMVPRDFESFPEREQTAIACHELLHVGRADWVRNAGDEIVRAALWFHPAIWWLIDEIQLAREQVVDREAVSRLGTRQPYLEALLRLAKPAPRLVLTPASPFLKRAHLRQRVALLIKEASMSRARLVASLAIMAVVVFVAGRIVTSALPLQQSGTRTPGVRTAVPKLTGAKLGAIDVTGTLRTILSTYTYMTGIAIATEISDRMLDQPITMKFAAGISPEQVLDFIAKSIGGSYRVTSERSVVLTGRAFLGDGVSSGSATGAPRPGMTANGGGVAGGIVGGVGGGVAGAARPGTATETGVGMDLGTGSGPGLAGGVFGATLTPVLRETVTVAGATEQGSGGGPSTGVYRSIGEFAHSVVARVDPAPGEGQPPVVTKVSVDANGSVTGVQVVSAPTGGDADAISAARQWLFAPASAPWTTYVAFSFAGSQPGAIPLTIGGNVRPPKKVADAKPVYPDEARQAGIQGVQILEAVIGEEGRVIDAWALRGQDALLPAALNAVLRWRFEPALLNGEPFPLKMTVTVNFTLDGATRTTGTAMPARDTVGTRSDAMLAGQYGHAADWPPEVLRVGGAIKPPTRVVDVKAVYPDIAQKAHVQGVVICDVLIGPDGRVKDARVVRSIPLLDQAAIDAVRQWEFTPTLVDGNPIPVVMTVTVNFTLQ